MNLTTKGRYAVMAMVDIAMQGGEKTPISLALVAERQEITLNYLEQIFVRLRKADVVKSVRGPGGGYVLSTSADEIRISDIIIAVDETIKMTRCSEESKKTGGCMHNRSLCATHALWDGLGKQIHYYLQSVTLADVCAKRINVPFSFPVSHQFGEVCAHG
jgi:Rrf2 family iron-sulfur cluster assembly transcriptional regulator